MAQAEPLAGSVAGAPVGSFATLTAASTYSSPDFQMAPRFRRINGWVESDVAGTLFLEVKLRGGSYAVVTTIPVAAATPTVFDYALPVGTARLRYLNGATNQGRFELEAYGVGNP